MGAAPITRPSLLLRVRDVNDDAAWAQFVEIYTPLIYAYCRSRGLQDSDAADVNMKATYSAKMNPYETGLPDSMQAKLTKGYEDLFKLFLKHKDKISRVTFWGVNDGQSWLNGWPIAGRTNYPLLFDRNFKPKPAFDAVISLKK